MYDTDACMLHPVAGCCARGQYGVRPRQGTCHDNTSLQGNWPATSAQSSRYEHQLVTTDPTLCLHGRTATVGSNSKHADRSTDSPVESMGSICDALRATEAASASNPAVPDTAFMYRSRTASGSAGTHPASGPSCSASASKLSTAVLTASFVLVAITCEE
jgi:hypothetical protein